VSDRGPLLARFEESKSELRALALVRGVCAVLAIAAASALLLGELPVPIFLVAVLALLISLVWLRQALRARKAAKQAKNAALLVYSTGFCLEDAGGSTWHGWEDVEQVEVNEERLDIVVMRRDKPPLRLEPRYAGVDIYQLVRTLDEARRSAPRSVDRGKQS
jgi:hypothetical protein